MAKIELIARPLEMGEDAYKWLEKSEMWFQHLFIMHTKDNGEQFSISGGPENFKDDGAADKVISSLLDDIKIRKKRFFSGDENGEGKFKEYFKSQLIIEGSDEEIKPYIDKIWHKAAGINRGGFDYKWPTAGDEQNSNTVARVMLEAAGLAFNLPSYKSGKAVLAPSYDAEINHTKLDGYGVGNKIKEFLFVKDMKRNLSVKINKAYAKYPDKIEEIKECIEEEVSKSRSHKAAITKNSGTEKSRSTEENGQKRSKEEINENTFLKVNKMFGYFDSIKDNGADGRRTDKKITNLDRFQSLEEKAKAKNDDEFAEIFGNLAKQQKQVQRLFEYMNNPEFSDNKNVADKMEYLNKNKEEIMDTNKEDTNLSLITSEFKGEVLELDTAFEKCVPHTFYSEDL